MNRNPSKGNGRVAHPRLGVDMEARTIGGADATLSAVDTAVALRRKRGVLVGACRACFW